MSRFMSARHAALVPYTPGEQPKERKYLKLNTNESPFPPSAKATEMAAAAAAGLQLYSDPECRELAAAAAKYFGIDRNRIIFSNGSDEVLNYAFMAFCDEDTPALFADITYGFYPVFANLNGVPYEEIPLKDDFSIDPEPYIGRKGTVFIANPNAQTGIELPTEEIERIVSAKTDSIVVIDEAYVDFGARSAVFLTEKYDNLLVVQTFSKSRSLAGARLGLAIGNEELIKDLETIRYSTNPYNVNSMSAAAGIGALLDDGYMKRNSDKIVEAREYTKRSLEGLGFRVTDSAANFVLAEHPLADGKLLYSRLKEEGVLVRHFDTERIRNWNRITIGSMEMMQSFIATLEKVMKEIVA